MAETCNVKDDPVAKQFGLSVDVNFLEIEGRVLPDNKVIQRIKERFGQPIKIKLAVVNVNGAIRQDSDLKEKTDVLAKQCSGWGLNFESIQYEKLEFRQPNFNLNQWLTNLKVNFTNFSHKENFQTKLGENSLAWFIISDYDTNLYHQLKYEADILIGLRTQVTKSKTFLNIGRFTLNANLFRKVNFKYYFIYLIFQMNNKVGGVNMKVEAGKWKEFTGRQNPTLFIGADVTHPVRDTNILS
jgi:hypothetical protein